MATATIECALDLAPNQLAGEFYALGAGDESVTRAHKASYAERNAECIDDVTVTAVSTDTDTSRQQRLSVMVSCVEVHGQQCIDLLGFQNSQVRVLEDARGNVSLSGVQTLSPSSPKELLEIIELAMARRKEAETTTHSHSSRSHLVCCLVVRGKYTDGRLVLVDLAGSERRADSMNHNRARLYESALINTGLMALKQCMCTFARNQRIGKSTQMRIPYRQHTITRILKASFTHWDARTVVIGTLSPASADTEHTIDTLNHLAFLAECTAGGVSSGSSSGNTTGSSRHMITEFNGSIDVSLDVATGESGRGRTVTAEPSIAGSEQHGEALVRSKQRTATTGASSRQVDNETRRHVMRGNKRDNEHVISRAVVDVRTTNRETKLGTILGTSHSGVVVATATTRKVGSRSVAPASGTRLTRANFDRARVETVKTADEISSSSKKTKLKTSTTKSSHSSFIPCTRNAVTRALTTSNRQLSSNPSVSVNTTQRSLTDRTRRNVGPRAAKFTRRTHTTARSAVRTITSHRSKSINTNATQTTTTTTGRPIATTQRTGMGRSKSVAAKTLRRRTVMGGVSRDNRRKVSESKSNKLSSSPVPPSPQHRSLLSADVLIGMSPGTTT
jgi:hypothetical protein